MRWSRSPLTVVLLVALVATGVAVSVQRVTNPSALPSALSVASDAESSALYCTGLSKDTGAPGVVTFYNLTRFSRRLSVEVVSNTGRARVSVIELAPYASTSVTPSANLLGTSYAVAVQVEGGGVVGEEVAGTGHALEACSNQGVTHWFVSGLSTLVGSSATISLYNPTATAAVASASIYTTSGLLTPTSFQGILVPAHHQVVVNLDAQVVNTSNFGVGLDVSRGSLVATGVEVASGNVSLDPGVSVASRESWFPLVATQSTTRSQIRIANPSSATVQVSIDVKLGRYKIAPQTLTISAYSSGAINIDPNVAIPAAGFASLRLRASAPVFSTLANGTSSQVVLSPAAQPTTSALIHDFGGLGFFRVSLMNTSSHALRVTLGALTSHGRAGATTHVSIGARTNESLAPLAPGLSIIATSARKSLIVTETLPSRPEGLYELNP